MSGRVRDATWGFKVRMAVFASALPIAAFALVGVDALGDGTIGKLNRPSQTQHSTNGGGLDVNSGLSSIPVSRGGSSGSAGPGSSSGSVTVPDVTGYDESTATSTLENAGFSVDSQDSATSDSSRFVRLSTSRISTVSNSSRSCA